MKLAIGSFAVRHAISIVFLVLALCFGGGYAAKKMGSSVFPKTEFPRVVIMVNNGVMPADEMMAAVTRARHAVLEPYLKPGHVAVASINSPMQCMMKEVCAQCLQKHVDPVTGAEKIVFSCFNQDQPADSVDWAFLNQRLRQNTMQEKLTNLWLERLLTLGDPAHIAR